MVENQAYLFLVFTLTGITIGLLFDFFRALRKAIKTVDFVTYIEDILFWTITGILILYNIWYFNNGEIRIYMFLGIIMGILIYSLILSSIFTRAITYILKKIFMILELQFKTIISIFSRIFATIKKIYIKIVKKYKKIENKRGNLEKNGE